MVFPGRFLNFSGTLMSRFAALMILLLAVSGCLSGPPIVAVVQPNPLPIPAGDTDFVWEQLIDVVDDDFRIQHEERVQQFGDFAVQGRIDTFPETGATYLEPWRKDSVGRFERTESTLQTIRRRAVLRVIPNEGGFLIDVAVYKELEDLPQPEHATASAATLRFDSSLRRLSDPVGGQPVSEGWIPLGRDVQLEQRMLAKIRSRLAYPVAAAPPY